MDEFRQSQAHRVIQLTTLNWGEYGYGFATAPRRARQQASFGGLIFVGLIAVAAFAIGGQSVPIFIQYMAIKKARSEAIARELHRARSAPHSTAAAAIDDIHSVAGKDLEVTSATTRSSCRSTTRVKSPWREPAYPGLSFPGIDELVPADSLTSLQQRLQHAFANPSLLQRAVTHHLRCRAQPERLEFLGDSVLNWPSPACCSSACRACRGRTLTRARPAGSPGLAAPNRHAVAAAGTAPGRGRGEVRRRVAALHLGRRARSHHWRCLSGRRL